MKFSNLYIIICMILLACFTQNCTEMNDMHQKFLEGGETVYAAKVDSVAPHAGDERIQFEMFVKAQRIDTVRIFWNNNQDSVDIAIGGQTGIIKRYVELEEKINYIFKFVSFDKFGNRSLPLEVTGNVYGDDYRSTLINRTILSTTPIVDGEITIQWGRKPNDGVACKVKYVNLNGEEDSLRVPMSEASTTLDSVDSNLNLRYKTLFLPEEEAIDTFSTEYKKVEDIKIGGETQ